MAKNSEVNQNISDFLDRMFSSSFYPLISRPTRITTTSATLIDNIFVNKLEENYKSGLLFTDLSDHLPIFQLTSNIKNKNTVRKDSKCRQINYKTLNKICLQLENEDWNDIYKITDPHDAYSTF